ncbi:tetratricopeptide repeat protein [Vibrio parahaemolyticus]|uniref:tetratricopeptide repeat protein n=1 Tax=Vibrio fluvialis TaxID=676 RepID=UPI0006E40265|nr:tetratricopeptide repeat protein [Vibrio fluvialis]EJE8515780.1 tetratricopeptide repeat protein [Vibrio parahaemolyticus]EJE8774452.1 tetratricopeptide repeat protein [Vibrio parahaemolyticus]KQH89396.1 hypothetical protein AMR75_12995 [Vibrio fluvialis]
MSHDDESIPRGNGIYIGPQAKGVFIGGGTMCGNDNAGIFIDPRAEVRIGSIDCSYNQSDGVHVTVIPQLEEQLERLRELERSALGNYRQEIACKLVELGSEYRKEAKQYDKALPLYQEANRIFQTMDGVQDQHVGSLMHIGITLRHLKRYDEAKRAYTEALRILDYIPDSGVTVANIFNNIGNLYLDNEQEQEALTEYKKALEKCEAMQKTEEVMRTIKTIETNIISLS